MKRAVSTWRTLLVFAAALLVPLSFLFSQVLVESFDYPEGTIGGQGDDSGGWGGPWEEVVPGYAEVVNESLGFDIIPTTGKALMVFESGTTFRYFAETWPDDGGEYWISMLYKRFDQIDVNDSYNGLSLFLDGQELLYIGKPWGTRMLGLDGTGVGIGNSTVDAYDGGWMVVQLIMSGDNANDEAYLWVNPDPNVQPSIDNADATVMWKGSNGFNRIRIGSGDPPNPAECYYDEIRIGRTYADVAGGGSVGDLPKPVSFFDFEESDGVIVYDQGTAGNHGEIYDPSGWLARDNQSGIYSKPGEGRGCIEFVEENAFGELCYVRVPYKDYMNSPNYTYSAWIQYRGTPNWGYIFWADGETWEPDIMDRHVDVWLNPSKNGADCILNLEDGSQFRVATSAAECGIELMNGDWHQVTVTLADAVEYKIYIDGVLCAEGTAASPVVENMGDDLFLGARPNNADAATAVKLVGLMDRVRIWDIALDEKQVELLYKMEGPNGGSVGIREKPAPAGFALLSNYPNPFNPATTIAYTLDRSSRVSLEIYDMTGRKVRTLFSGIQPAGRWEQQWNGRDDAGRDVPSGVYLYCLRADERTASGKMTLLR